MKLLAISVGKSRQIEYNNRSITTGIYKHPIEGPVRISASGLEGDIQVDRKNHGGPDKAIYAYTVENYRYWESVLESAEFPYGQFGENFSVSGMPDDFVHIGDIFRMGRTLVQVTQPRVPCFKLGIKMGDPGFVDRFLRSGRVGFYLRVLEGGKVEVGDSITKIEENASRLNIRDCMLALIKGPRQHEIIEQALTIKALSEAWKKDLQHRRKP